jgi:ribose transport system ATP-binding protein
MPKVSNQPPPQFHQSDAGKGRFDLRVRNLRKSFGGIEVLHGVDVDVVGGRVLALLGENGAGKSTLVRVLAGDHQPDGGTLETDSKVFRGFDPITARAAGVRMSPH